MSKPSDSAGRAPAHRAGSPPESPQSASTAPVVPGRLAVLGVGQLGGSMALAGREAGLFAEVVGYGRSESSLRRAHEGRLIDRIASSPADAVAGAEVVVLAAPLRAVPALLASAAPALALGALVVDVGSVKAEVIAQIEARLPNGVDFVGCHPLAGTERFGPEAATPDLFRGRPCIVCPTSASSDSARRRARALWTALGAEVVEMGSVEHDELMAAASHLPHVVAYALARVVGETAGERADVIRALRLTSLRDTTRVAASSPHMWRDIFAANREALLPLVDELVARLGELREAIAEGDTARIETFLDGGRAARTRLFPP